MTNTSRISKFIKLCQEAEAFPWKFDPINDDELDRLETAVLNLYDIYLDYKANNNPLHLAKAICWSIESEFNIPHWAELELYKNFKEYEASNGKISLDKVFKSEGSGLGGPPLKRLEAENNHRNIAYHVETLYKLGFSKTIAFNLVSHRSKDIASVSLSIAWVRDLYYKYKKICGDKGWFGILWGDDYKNPRLCSRFIFDNGYLLSDDENCPVITNPKLKKTYYETVFKIISAA